MNEEKRRLLELFYRAAKLIQRYKYQSLRNCTAPIADTSRGQGRVLALLNIQPEMSQKDLAYLLGIRNQSISELVAKLEKAGYVTKEPSANDKRVMNVKLTEKGKKAANQTNTQMNDYEDILDCLSPEEQANMAEYLSRLIAEMEKGLGEEDPFPSDFQGDIHENFRIMFEKLHQRVNDHDPRDFGVDRVEHEMPDWKVMHERMARGFGRDLRDFGGSPFPGNCERDPFSTSPRNPETKGDASSEDDSPKAD